MKSNTIRAPYGTLLNDGPQENCEVSIKFTRIKFTQMNIPLGKN